MSGKGIVVVGGGGHGSVLIDLLTAAGDWQVAGIVDNGIAPGEMVAGQPVLGGDSQLPELLAHGVRYACVGVGMVASGMVRRRLFEELSGLGFVIPTLVHPAAVVSHLAKVEEGAQILALAHVGVRSVVGRHAIVNTGAVVDHDCYLGAHSHLAVNATLCGDVRVGDDSLVGAGATVINGCSIGERVLVGAGALVNRDLPPDVVAYGVPARIRHREEE